MRIFLFVLLLPLLPLACGPAEHDHAHDDHTAHDHDHDHEAAGESMAVQLNNGARWEANPETTEGIRNMTKLVEDFSPSESRGYADLLEDLKAEFAGIFEKCTMKGEAHNQLHNYLLPMRTMFDDLASGTDSEHAQTLADMHAYLSNYFVYFK